MKYLGLFLLVVLCSTSAFSAISIVGSKHDFSSKTWGNSQICAPCHAPHGNYGVTDYLWNHATSTATYTKWSSMSTIYDGSKRCLGCHDGTVALDAFNGNPGGAAYMSERVPGHLDNYGVGTDLSNDHPISVAYTSLSTDTKASTRMRQATVGTGSTPSASVYGIGDMSTKSLRLGYNDSKFTVECNTCHAVHGSESLTVGTAFPHFLRMDNSGSKLCLSCHLK